MARRKYRLARIRKPPLRVSKILEWADAYHRRTGRWPNRSTGEVAEAPWDKWTTIDSALAKGARGLRPAGSLLQLLVRHRGVRNIAALPRLTIGQILAWADAHRRRTGKWPSAFSTGPIHEAPGESWGVVNQCLQRGMRGLRAGDTLARVLLRCRKVHRTIYRPRLSVRQILAWADEHHRRTGAWPIASSGPIEGAPGETWLRVHEALRVGTRGLAGGSTLARLLRATRGVIGHGDRPPLKKRQILAWADAHFRRTGNYPTAHSGPILDAPRETWTAVDKGFHKGNRGLPANYSLYKFLTEHGRHRIVHMGRPARAPGEPRWRILPPLTKKEILAWADAHHQRTGEWPRQGSGPIRGAPRPTTWKAVNMGLMKGTRGLPGGTTLRTFLIRHGREPILHRGFPAGTHLRPLLDLRRILAWADAHHRVTGEWPTGRSGRIRAAPEVTWSAVNHALRRGHRGLPASGSLFQFLNKHGRKARGRGGAPKGSLLRSPLREQQILAWADAHHRRTGRWPSAKSGPITGTRSLTWKAVEHALVKGLRGLPRGSSLSMFLSAHGRHPIRHGGRRK